MNKARGSFRSSVVLRRTGKRFSGGLKPDSFNPVMLLLGALGQSLKIKIPQRREVGRGGGESLPQAALTFDADLDDLQNFEDGQIRVRRIIELQLQFGELLGDPAGCL